MGYAELFGMSPVPQPEMSVDPNQKSLASLLMPGEGGGIPGGFGGLDPHQWGSIAALFGNAQNQNIARMQAMKPVFGHAAPGAGTAGGTQVQTKETKTQDVAPLMSLAALLGFRG